MCAKKQRRRSEREGAVCGRRGASHVSWPRMFPRGKKAPSYGADGRVEVLRLCYLQEGGGCSCAHHVVRLRACEHAVSLTTTRGVCFAHRGRTHRRKLGNALCRRVKATSRDSKRRPIKTLWSCSSWVDDTDHVKPHHAARDNMRGMVGSRLFPHHREKGPPPEKCVIIKPRGTSPPAATNAHPTPSCLIAACGRRCN